MLRNILKNMIIIPRCRFSGYVSHRQRADNNDSTPFQFTDENYKIIDGILKKYPSNWKRSAIIPLLHLAQKQNNNFLPLSAMKKIAKIVQVNEMDIYEVVSFYTMFNRQRVGKYHLQICGTTPCQLRGAQKIIEACQKHLGIKCGQTTPDKMFTIQEVQCLGACVNAPMLQVNGQWVYQDLTPATTVELLEKLKTGKDVKGPQIKRNNCQGPMGRTTLKDIKIDKQVRYDRDFEKSKKEWQLNQKKKLQAQKKKAEEVKRIQEEKKKGSTKKI